MAEGESHQIWKKNWFFYPATFTDNECVKWLGRHFNHNFSLRKWSETEKDLHINVKELLAIYYSLQVLCAGLSQISIILKTDSSAIVSYINKQWEPKSDLLNDIPRKTFFWNILRNIKLEASHITWKPNVEADSFQRIFSHGN